MYYHKSFAIENNNKKKIDKKNNSVSIYKLVYKGKGTKKSYKSTIVGEGLN